MGRYLQIQGFDVSENLSSIRFFIFTFVIIVLVSTVTKSETLSLLSLSLMDRNLVLVPGFEFQAHHLLYSLGKIN